MCGQRAAGVRSRGNHAVSPRLDPHRPSPPLSTYPPPTPSIFHPSTSPFPPLLPSIRYKAGNTQSNTPNSLLAFSFSCFSGVFFWLPYTLNATKNINHHCGNPECGFCWRPGIGRRRRGVLRLGSLFRACLRCWGGLVT
jgi:hypothetical protein